MRLKSVYVSQYKNLKDFTLSLDAASFIDVFVGKNGSGKSNLFEALIEIFRHLDQLGLPTNEIAFDYRLNYEINGQDTEIEWKADRLRINKDEDRKTLGQTPFPDNVLIYYSGHNNTVSDLVGDYEAKFRNRIKAADLEDSRRFIGIGQEYKALLLAILLVQPEDGRAHTFIRQKLGIERLGIAKPGTEEASESVLKIDLKRPDYARGSEKEKYDVDPLESESRYWRPIGITKDFLDILGSCGWSNTKDLTVTEGYLPNEDRYVLYLSIVKLQGIFAEKWQELFRQFDNLKTLGMLDAISVPLRLTSGLEGNVGHFSDGQFQSVYIYSIVELFKDRNCLVLLDEPDAFLHPEWQFDFLRQVFGITDTTHTNNHVLMSSHSAATLLPLAEQRISFFKIENSIVSCSKRTKKEIIHELSDSFIQYSEDESKLLIDNVIRSSQRPILFVEGPSDVSILNAAFRKLYPQEDIPILIQDAFDRGFIKILLSRNEIFKTYPDKQFFALFDFDDAYDDWRSLGGEHQITDISQGLCRKLPGKNAHAFLLPVPDNALKAQVWDETNPNEKIRPNPYLGIEHLFWGVDGLADWFRTDEKTGNISFKGDKYKVKFAKDIVPSLDAACFEVFRPMFDLIRLKCNTVAISDLTSQTT
ncbi:AAA family ATPase [Massilia sp. YIM B02769]|uniref:AAA family ATPase n=1 Tax=Massilia sp. YIM B02769 TaxID=3050129 RepID=UPI0025B6E6CD|nr:AAA family ATPase [Massilia sp. YIM B02769]MDN4059829.1 AAA family ATPase [Massilia sp. YIM B02769]